MNEITEIRQNDPWLTLTRRQIFASKIRYSVGYVRPYASAQAVLLLERNVENIMSYVKYNVRNVHKHPDKPNMVSYVHAVLF